MLVLNFLASVAVLLPLVSGAPISIKKATPSNQQACHCPKHANVNPKSLTKRILGLNLGTDMLTDNMLAVMGKGAKHKHTHAHVTLLQINVPGGCCGGRKSAPGSPMSEKVPDSPFDTPKSDKASNSPFDNPKSDSTSMTAPQPQSISMSKSVPKPKPVPVPGPKPVPEPKPVSSAPWNWPVAQPKQKMDKRAGVAEFIGGNILGKLGKSTASQHTYFTLPHALGGVRKQKQPKAPKPKKEPKQKQKVNGNQ
ncbi:hypothetical protein HYALB_00013598 [Hymenoscyphus albidus]|uniref:Secreted protein n=1 Tax=Hymenoscyphus albidus TaxID=595503 RepID=A0A9N9QAH3_9HELO|nr:hypothetical protein HYALB_00013598 [Hymenoscyphus albidus]